MDQYYYITVVLIFVFYLLLVFTFYIFTSTIVKGDRTYRRVRYNDPAVDNLLEIVSNELQVAVIPILVILLTFTPRESFETGTRIEPFTQLNIDRYKYQNPSTV